MKTKALALTALALATGIVGCSGKPPRTTSVKVQNPLAQKQPAPQPTAPGQPPSPASAQPKQPAPVVGKWVKLSDGLEYVERKIGKGEEARAGHMVTVTYKGWLDNGKVFDASSRHQGSFSFALGAQRVIRGWDEGVQGMKIGGVRELKVPPALGYGDMEQPAIPADSTLHFEIKLLSIEN